MKSLGDLETLPPFGFIFAHQGGWDEILLVAGPLVIIGILLWVANRRVEAQVAETERIASEEEQGSPEQR